MEAVAPGLVPAAEDAAPVLGVSGLKFCYNRGSEELFGGLSHEFGAGKVTVVTGASGRGKSTLLYMLGLMLTPTSGDVMIDAHPVSKTRDSARSRLRASRIGFVFQDSELDPSRRILDCVMEPGLYVGRSLAQVRPRAWELLRQFGLDDRATHRPGQVSGGQAQRVAVCRALVNNPDIVLADEPTGNLDRDNAALVLGVLAGAAHDGGRTVVIASHDPFVVGQADEVVEL